MYLPLPLLSHVPLRSVFTLFKLHFHSATFILTHGLSFGQWWRQLCPAWGSPGPLTPLGIPAAKAFPHQPSSVLDLLFYGKQCHTG